jgi:hypothetical protein
MKSFITCKDCAIGYKSTTYAVQDPSVVKKADKSVRRRIPAAVKLVGAAAILEEI